MKEKKIKSVPVLEEKQELFSSKEYSSTLADLKKRIRESQVKAVIAANKELISLYWTIGRSIVERQEKNGWGTKFIEKLANDLQNAFPGIEGFSRRNLFRMRAFYLESPIVPQAVAQIDPLEHLGILAQIPWGHNVLLIEKIDGKKERLWYANKAVEHGWSRSVLESWIKSDLYRREGKAVTNFKDTLPAPQSDMAQQALKDPFVFDFLTLHKDHLEKDLENGLVTHIQKFLLELGQGFSFLGRQYPLEVGGEQFYADLVFYHIKLRSFVIIEIKAKPFRPEDAGQLNFYLSAADSLLKHPSDNPSIGILLCKSRNKVVAEYAFREMNKPMGVVEYETMLTKALPEEMKSSLPTIKEIEEELEREMGGSHG